MIINPLLIRAENMHKFASSCMESHFKQKLIQARLHHDICQAALLLHHAILANDYEQQQKYGLLIWHYAEGDENETRH